jgi:hypothetical protein
MSSVVLCKTFLEVIPMSFYRSFAKALFTVLLIPLLVLENSCTTWKAQIKLPADVGSNQKVRLEVANHKKVVVYGPAIDGGNLVGWEKSNHKGPRNASYPLSEIQSIEVRRTSVGRTIGAIAVGLGAGATIAVIALLAKRTPYTPPPPTKAIASCPFVYSDTGHGWRLDSGTFGGAIMQPLARTDVDNLDFVRPRNGVLRLKVANELDETDHVDAIEVLAVDHEMGTTIGPSPQGDIHVLGSLVLPISARDFEGRDVLASVLSSDDRSWESRLAVRNPATAESLRDGIELEFPMPSNTTTARLVVDGRNTPWAAFLMKQFIQAHGTGTAAWYASMEANPSQALQLQAQIAREAFLRFSVWNGSEWEDRGTFWEAGPEISKRQVISFDLAGIPGDTLRVRLSAPASFWLVDSVGIDWGTEHSFSSQALTMQSAIDRKGVNLRGVLASADSREVQLETGDSIELRFGAPPIIPGKARSYILRSTGWYKIHASEEGLPDLQLLNAVSEPGGIARLSAISMNAALEMLRVKEDAK